jgi:hypothetical protein
MEISDSVICQVVCSNYTADEEMAEYGHYHGQVGILVDICNWHGPINSQPFYVKFKSGAHLWCSEVTLLEKCVLPKELFEI